MDLASLVDHLRTRVPELPHGLNAEFDITRSGILDHAQRVALRHAVVERYPTVSPAAVDGCATIGDALALVESADTTTPPGSSPLLARGEYRSRHVHLRPLRPADTPLLYEAALEPRNAHRWRFRGRTPSPEVFQSQLYHTVLCQFAVEHTAESRMLGLVSCYDEHSSAQHAKIAFQRCTKGETGGEMIEGLALFINYLFDHWPLRKLYAEIPEYNLPLLDGLMAAGFLETEAVLREFEHYNNQLWDVHIASLSRQSWETFMDSWNLTDSRQARPSL